MSERRERINAACELQSALVNIAARARGAREGEQDCDLFVPGNAELLRALEIVELAALQAADIIERSVEGLQ